MRIILYSLILLLYTAACSQVYFASPQPDKGVVIKTFMQQVQGVYADSLIEVEVMKDKVFIAGTPFKLVSKSPGENEVLVRFYNNAYFASMKDSLWYTVMMVRFEEEKMAVYLPGADAISVARLKRLVAVDTLDAARRYYLIDPNTKEFDKLLSYEIFEVAALLQKVKRNQTD